MRTLLKLGALSILAMVGACGDESVQGPAEEPEPEPTLDFGLIQGAWSGTATTAANFPFWIEADLSSGGKKDRPVGTVRYGSGSTAVLCSGSWLAESAQDPVYTVSERIGEGDCPNGTVRLERDPEGGTLVYSFTTANAAENATGSLTRND